MYSRTIRNRSPFRGAVWESNNMRRRYKRSNGRVQLRGRGGRFRHTTLEDFGASTCSNSGCNRFSVRVYEGDPEAPFVDPFKFRYRCYHCEPKTAAEAAADSKAQQEQPKETTIEDVIKRMAK